MASKEKKFYTLDNDKKRIVVDKTVTPTDADVAMMKVYVSMGYEVAEKSEKRAAAMKKKAANLPDKTAIMDAIKSDTKAVAIFNAIMKGEDKSHKKGFFAARAWYMNEYTKK